MKVSRTTKVCTKCNIEYPSTSFHRRNDTKDKLNSWCKYCKNKWHRENPSDWKKAQVKRLYGITIEEYNTYIEGASCGICGSLDNLCLDHCHTTGRIRGALCKQCNSGIGMLKDDEELLRKAAEWVKL